MEMKGTDLEIEDLTLNEDEEKGILAMAEEEKDILGVDDDDDNEEAGEGALYDKDLFAHELGDVEDEDVDFD